MERLVVDLELLAAVEEDARERPIEVVAPLDPRDLHRAHRIEHAVRPDRQTRGAQHAGEVHHVLCKTPVRCHFPAGSRSSVSITTLTLLAPTLIGVLEP